MLLWIIRHADAEPARAGTTDFERPLSALGVADCARVRAALEALGARADPVVASDARRARATAELLAPGFGRRATDVRLEPRIYAADADDLLDLLRETPAAIETLALVGHNPGVSALVERLLGNGWRRSLPPLGTLCARLEPPWERLREGSATLAHFLDPANLE